ncbi:phosphotyrosine protein phosphatase [Leifsonia sp. LS1]|uniref:tyrosine-protein phosphatase n=1 Tax=Leifsonia sp. LS1 TaxID=2828483 RepID=UPI001CFDD5FB|nr:tyrosine-protein phosphatase [Leifsonia sp. LS1]GIT81240.1 phosphotyrosine protein phosphatase [Leifsonia sp. LS1]
MELTSVLDGTHNARDLGGTDLDSGATVIPGRLVRSDALATLTPTGTQGVLDLRIGTVIDLRTDGERRRAPDVLPAGHDVELVELPILGGAMDELVRQLLPSDGQAALDDQQLAALVQQIPTLEDLYVAILRSSAPQFARIARIVAGATGTERPGVLFHCTAGKDRTGLAAALLLAVAGAERAAIVADYELTQANLAGAFADALTGLITQLGIPLVPRLETLATKAPASAITAALDWVEANHGDAAGYLRSGGATEAEVAAVREALRG